ncbi:hypothetical protein BaRGS_00023521 [Batillaria attramentaria]|uniref:Uncharacterized protein n=1 Tax=Batillaria attramentaria TaxID=370345 RepID=A0ABD0KEA6_9CAEN
MELPQLQHSNRKVKVRSVTRPFQSCVAIVTQDACLTTLVHLPGSHLVPVKSTADSGHPDVRSTWCEELTESIQRAENPYSLYGVVTVSLDC